LAYSQPSNGVEDSAGNDLLGFSATSVTNNSERTDDADRYTLWPSDVVVGTDTGSGNGVVLGVRFQSSVPGQIVAMRFYEHASSTGAHVGTIWTSGGESLGSLTFTEGNTPPDWQEEDFTTPVQINANTEYIASVHFADGYWTSTIGYFDGSGVSSPPLSAPVSSSSSWNGVYLYTDSTTEMPYQGSTADRNYWVDIVFEASSSVGGGFSLDGCAWQ
jgi:hypothetical protein